MGRTLLTRLASLIFPGMSKSPILYPTFFFFADESSVCVNYTVLYAAHMRWQKKMCVSRGIVKSEGLVENCFGAVCVILLYVTLDKIDYIIK